jgi:hypothetical protein
MWLDLKIMTVSLYFSNSTVDTPRILSQFPLIEEEFSKSVPLFCFPGWPNELSTSEENHIYYSFALQAGDGTRRYGSSTKTFNFFSKGFCHRVPNPIHSKGPPECLCMISAL